MATMTWRKGIAGDTWHRYEVYRALRKDWKFTIEPFRSKRFYVLAEGRLTGLAANSLWPEYGVKSFATIREAMAWAEHWNPLEKEETAPCS